MTSSKKILLPIDGSPLGERIVDLARILLAQEDTEVVLLRVLAPPSENPSREDRAFEASIRARLGALQDRLSRLGARARSEIVYARDPAAGILSFANELGPSLIIASTRGETASPRWIRGGVAERLLQQTEHPVLLADTADRDGKAPAPLALRTILVPLDGSQLAARVLPLVRNVARLCGSEVVLLHVVQAGAGRSAISARAAESLLHEHRGKHFEDVRVRTLVSEGDPASVILQTIESEKPDLVALTTHGKSGGSRWAFGSVAERVLSRCASPLLLYRTSGFAAAKPQGEAVAAAGR